MNWVKEMIFRVRTIVPLGRKMAGIASAMFITIR